MLFLGIQDCVQLNLVRPMFDDLNETPKWLEWRYHTVGRQKFEYDYTPAIYEEEGKTEYRTPDVTCFGVIDAKDCPVAYRVLSVKDITLPGVSIHTIGRLMEMIGTHCTYRFYATQLIRVCKLAKELKYPGIESIEERYLLSEIVEQRIRDGKRDHFVDVESRNLEPLLRFMGDYLRNPDVRKLALKCSIKCLGRDLLGPESEEYLRFVQRESWLRLDPSTCGGSYKGDDSITVYGELGYKYVVPLKFAADHLPQLRGCKLLPEGKGESVYVVLDGKGPATRTSCFGV